MRQVAVLLSLIVALSFPGSAFAYYNCTSAPQYVAIGYGYWDYTHNPLTTSYYDCWNFSDTTNTYIKSCTLDSCGKTGWCAQVLYQTISQSFTVGANDSGTSNWDVWWSYEVNSPNSDYYDDVVVTVTVTHNGTGHSYYWAHHGNSGSVQCDTDGLSISAVNGDTISTTISLDRANTNATVGVSDYHIWRHDF